MILVLRALRLLADQNNTHHQRNYGYFSDLQAKRDVMVGIVLIYKKARG
jgi:hypothetical protein